MRTGGAWSGWALCLYLCLASVQADAAVLFHEDFETDGQGVRYQAQQPFTTNLRRYFHRTDGSNIDLDWDDNDVVGAYTGYSGNYFWAGENLAHNGPGERTITFSGIDIAGFTNLQFTGLFAAGRPNAYDITDFIRVEYSIDGGPLQTGLQFSYAPVTAGATTNQPIAQDTNFDGIGDGALLNRHMQNFGFALPHGSEVDLIIRMHMDAPQESFAFDNFMITGQTMGPRPDAPLAGELLVSEVMFQPAAGGERWQWIELYNASDRVIDLEGLVLDTAAGGSMNMGNIGAGLINPGETAVLYNADPLKNGLTQAVFAEAWGEDINLVPVLRWPDLSDDTQVRLGIWDSVSSYLEEPTDRFATTVVDVSIPTAGPVGHSITLPLYDMPLGYSPSALGVDGAYQSVGGMLIEEILNDVRDLGNPGLLPGGTPTLPLLFFTEIMFNPYSENPTWEWAEVYNNTGQTIDFSLTPWYIDDIRTGFALAGPNITTGIIEHGQTAILFNGDALSIELMQLAWGTHNNYIPVSNWDQIVFSNAFDTISLWNSAASYSGDSGTHANAHFSFSWSTNVLGRSIYLSDLSLDPWLESNWVAGSADDGLSYHAGPSGPVQMDNSGQDVGSPGLVLLSQPAPGEEPGDGPGSDSGRGGAGAAVPEPGTGAMLIAAVAPWLLIRRRGHVRVG